MKKWTGRLSPRLTRALRYRGAHEINREAREMAREQQWNNLYLMATFQTKSW